jgi:hypothetical protein
MVRSISGTSLGSAGTKDNVDPKALPSVVRDMEMSVLAKERDLIFAGYDVLTNEDVMQHKNTYSRSFRKHVEPNYLQEDTKRLCWS